MGCIVEIKIGTPHINILYPGDVTLFPRGLLHFEINVGKVTADYLSALNSQNPGTLVGSFPHPHTLHYSSSFFHSFILHMCVACVSRNLLTYVLYVCYMCVHAVGQPVAVPGAGTRACHVIECQHSGGG